MDLAERQNYVQMLAHKIEEDNKAFDALNEKLSRG